MPKYSKLNRMTEPRRWGVKAALCGFLRWFPIVAALFFASGLQAGRDIDQNEALRLVEQGVVLPLQRFIDDAQQRFPGRLLEVELEWDDDRYVYELEIVTRSGIVLELDYDAVTGKLLDVDEDD